MANLYRKSSLNRLSTPEQLDKMIEITSPMSWLALIGVALALAALVVWSIFGKLPTTVSSSGVVASAENAAAAYAEHTGTLSRYSVTEGSSVKAGDVLAKISTSSGEINVKAECDGTASKLLVETGQEIAAGTEVVRITPKESGNLVVLYVPVTDAQSIKSGMEVTFTPVSGESSDAYGKVLVSSTYAASISNMPYVVGTDNGMADLFVQNGPVCAIVCKLNNGLPKNTLVTGKIVTENVAPISKFLTNLKDNT